MSALGRRLRQDIWQRPDANFAALDGMRGFASVIVVIYHCAMFMGFLTPQVTEEVRYPIIRAVANVGWS